MIHGSGPGLLDPGLRTYTFLGGKADPLIFRGSQICFLGAKIAPCLWRADLSFRSSVTVYGNIAKVLKYPTGYTLDRST